jgi:para-nitrobenzyl esterase
MTHSFSRLFLAAVLVCTLPLAAQVRATVDTGVLEGKLSADGKIQEFRGVPYAAPPLANLRWRAPQPVAAWTGVRKAVDFSPHCMQPAIFKDMVFRDSGQSEDCLTLNVWAPAHRGTALLPVMVWIHGGGYNAGGSSEPRQDAERLANHGVVAVNFNYRLGIFGFLAQHELAAESPRGAAGNYGLMDQVAALKWVQRNIAAFGGDPAKVTIFGESAGSVSVSAMMAAPSARGLFIRAIGESGSAMSPTGLIFPPLAVSEWQNEAFIAAAFGAQMNLAGLRSLSADDILHATATRKDSPLFAPDIDGDVIPRPLSELYSMGAVADIPLLAGWNRNEALQDPPVQSRADLERLAQYDFGVHAANFLRLYASGSSDPAQAANDLAADRFMGYCTWRWLEAAATHDSAPVFRYHFEQPSPGDAFHDPGTAYHSDEIAYVFGTLDSRPGAHWRTEDYALSKLMQSYWVNFATTGTPDAPGLPAWPSYNRASSWEVMHLTPQPSAQPDTLRDRYLFLTQVWGLAPQVTPSR